MAYKCPVCHIAFPFGSKHIVFNEVVAQFLRGVSVENIDMSVGFGSLYHNPREAEEILREEIKRLHKKQSHKAFWKEKDGK